ncbi:hypothetical protein MRB53_029445 [Persea americana]|uniref:Uncharacterized protein n=1 Tax=Persea americana TaxID=3435 RepID=A0ACC2KIS1_PERAE|nr:hypothetical protein MRB53_029445 [Persea americana]|eukprot:TRINITY_DN4095_c0_g1_i1.p1 TRINITY_DN4095_c0_g1~~TRINITY_DN4095_c0_g1_i1.p1  ORF type:complete len:186 (+),score=27.70 TRINITY_DN4095_c0_g1_i1:244-801(+)
MRNFDENKPMSLDHLLTHRALELSLRLLVIPFCVASLWVMATNKQLNSDYGLLDFRNITGTKYLVCINAICAGCALVGVALSLLKCMKSDWVFFVSDQVLAYLMVTSGSAVIEILYLGYMGDREVSWSEACSSYSKFCSKTKLSLVLHMVSMLFFFLLSVISAYRVFNKFGAPYVSSKEEGEPVE